MPSDVQFQTPTPPSSSLSSSSYVSGVPVSKCSAQSESNRGSVDRIQLVDDGCTTSAVFVQRYNALRDAGFDELTANKYSSMYSSVNEVIDAILSQSLSDHLAIDQHSKGSCNRLTDGITTTTTSDHRGNSLVDCVCLPSSHPYQHQHHCAAINRHCHLSQGNNNAKLEPNDHYDESHTNCSPNHSHNNSINLTDCGSDDVSATEKFPQNKDTDLELKCNQFGMNARNGVQYNVSGGGGGRTGDCFAHLDHQASYGQRTTVARLFDQLKNGDNTTHYQPTNLLVNVLKDGFLDSGDEVNLEDEGVADQNVASTSPSASSSSGASSLLLEISSSPSSFSSLSSSISTTPPNASNSFDSNLIDANLGNSLFSFNFGSSGVDGANCPAANHKAVPFKQFDRHTLFDVFAESTGVDGDLTMGHLANIGENGSISNSIHNNGPMMPFVNQDHLTSVDVLKATNFSQSGHNSFLAKDLSTPSYPIDGSLFGENPDNQYCRPSNRPSEFSDHIYDDKLFLSQSSDLVSEVPHNVFNVSSSKHPFYHRKYSPEDCALSGTQQSNELCSPTRIYPYCDHFDQSGSNDLTNNMDSKLSKSGGFFGVEQSFGIKKDYHPFNDISDLLLTNSSSQSTDVDLLSNGLNQQSYSAGFMNHHKTFADIAASSLSNNGQKGNSENFLGPIGDCKTSKSNQSANMSINTQMNGNKLNGYFNLFSSNGKSPNSASSPLSYYEQNSMGKKPAQYCAQNGYKSQLSPIANKFSCPPNSMMMQNENLNFGHQGQLRTGNHSLQANMDMSNMNPNEQGSGAGNRPTNLMGYKGLWVCNISPEVTLAYLKRRFRRFGHFTGIQTFERRATNGSNIVFVHYDNPYSPVEAIHSLHNYTGQDLCADQCEPLKLRFAPSAEQSRAGQLPTLEQARKIVERSGECFNWRLSSGCHRGMRCQLKHHPINKEIDSQPWVKALKKKNNE